MRYLFLWLSFLTMSCPAKDPVPPAASDLFTWYDRLGFEDVSKAKFARIWTGSSTMLNGVRLNQDISNGFILEDHGDSFRAVLADLTVATFKKAGTKTDEPEFCGYQEIALKDEAQQLIKALQNPRYFERWEEDDDRYHFAYHDRLSRHAQVFVIARECARRDMLQLGTNLANALARHSIKDGANRWRSYPDWLKDDLADAIDWRARIAFRDPNQSWENIRSLFQRIVDHCPDAFAAERAQNMVKNISSLLDQNKARKPGASDDPEELVWKLHDEQNEKWEDDYWPRPYPFAPRKSNGTLAALRALGNKAVPAILAELQREPRPSRTASRSTRYGGGVWLQDTRDLALGALSDIAGFNFYWLIGWSREEERKWERMTSAIADWWTAVGNGKEREWLVKVVRAGGRPADAVSDALLQRYPEEFFEAAVSAIRNSNHPNDPHPRRQFIERLLKLKDPRVEIFLGEEITKAPTMEARVQLASALRQLGRSDGERRILEEVRKLTAADFEKAISPAPPSDPPSNAEDEVLTALGFLFESNSPEPFTFLIDSWPHLPFGMRVDCIRQLSRRNLREEVDSIKPPTPEAQTQIKAIFLLALEDTRPQRGATYTYEGGSVFEPRLCDLAADALHGHWPDQFEFDRQGVESKRERQRVTILNPYLRQLGRPELPMPKDRPKVPQDKANVVADIEWEEKSDSPADPLRKILNSWIGKPITGKRLVAAITDFARSLERRKHNLQLAVLRDGDQTGIYVRVRRSPPHGDGTGISAREFVTVGGEITLQSAGSGIADRYDSPEKWEDLQRRVDEALRSPPEKPFVIQVAVGSGEDED